MDLKATRAQSGLKWTLVRTCILALFLLTGVLLESADTRNWHELIATL
jgi:hypothetical protein